jgi:hypothetical protein
MCYMALEPGTWADWMLVIVGLIGGVVAYQTLSALKKQAQQAAKETILLNRAYLQIDSWMPSTAFFTEANGSQGADCTVEFRIFNYSKTAARIEEIELNYRVRLKNARLAEFSWQIQGVGKGLKFEQRLAIHFAWTAL